MSKSLEELQAEWDAILESEGLGVIQVDRPYRGDNIKNISGKHKALDARINGITKSGQGFMTNSPVTARAVESRHRDPDSAQSEFNDGLWDDDEVADNVWDALALSMTATPKEAELADRARGALYGLDDKKSFENVKQWVEEIDRYAGEGVVKLLVGNKCDVEARQVTREEAEKFAEELKMRYMETSAKTGENVEETFMLTAREIKAKGVPKPKPSAAQTVNTAAAPEQKPGKGCAC